MKTKALLIIGPTAVGKSSILERALNDYPMLVDIITYTTRPMRAGESEGRPYHFVDENSFKLLVEQKFFIEWAIVHGRMYGTPRDQVRRATEQGKGIVIDIDVQGAKTMLREFPEAVTIFLMPPSLEALRQRFIKRGVTSQADLDKRLESAKTEMAQADHFQHVIVNDDFDQTYSEIRKIIENLLKNQ
ncbi:MAG: guanylate kinase [Bdellovibrionales bacterium]